MNFKNNNLFLFTDEIIEDESKFIIFFSNFYCNKEIDIQLKEQFEKEKSNPFFKCWFLYTEKQMTLKSWIHYFIATFGFNKYHWLVEHQKSHHKFGATIYNENYFCFIIKKDVDFKIEIECVFYQDDVKITQMKRKIPPKKLSSLDDLKYFHYNQFLGTQNILFKDLYSEYEKLETDYESFLICINEQDLYQHKQDLCQKMALSIEKAAYEIMSSVFNKWEI